MIPRIFDLFAQADRSLDRAQGGLGVGLTLARRLVELHGGKLDAFSAGSGRGSRFVVRLPRAADALAARTPVPANAPGARLRSLRVLVVDDNSDAAESLGLLLRMTGYEVQVAHDGPTALTMAVSSLPEVVVLDIGLPGLDGYQVAARLRQYDGTKHSVLIALTGYGQEGDKVRSKQAGFDYHLVKPAEPEQLQDLLTRVAMQHR
jgi:two-component system CheB/CheR fusion protein